MDINIGDVLYLKNSHPCGSHEFEVTRIGADFKLKCVGCGREFMITRVKAEKSIKRINARKEDSNA